jgi:predicted AlkP superfamily phosphohydrolase/phosphomutase
MGIRRLLIVGWDCADPDVTDSLCARGRLPNLSALRRRGLYTPIASTLPPSSLPAWTSVFTGVGPGRHGLCEYVQKEPGTYRLRLVTSADRRAETIFSLAHRAGLRVACLGVPGTFPPDPEPDVCIAGFDSPLAQKASRRAFSPAFLHRKLRRKNLYWPYGGVDELAVGPGWHRAARRVLLESVEHKSRVAEEILRGDWFDLFTVVFSEIDTASHHFWAYHDGDSPRHRRDPELSGVLEEVYVAMDRTLGGLLARLDQRAAVLVLSDHGAGGSSDHVFCLNRWLASGGWLRFRGASGLPGRGAAWFSRYAARFLPAGVKEALLRSPLAGPVMRADAWSRFGGLDFQRTRAYSDELPQNPGIWINLRGRDPQGTVAPGAEYEDLRDEIIGELEAFRDPHSQRPLVDRVLKREAAVSGPYAGRSPDLLVQLSSWDGYKLLAAPSAGRRGRTVRRLASSELVGSKGVGVSGVHRSEGILVAAGPRIRADESPEEITLVDVFPLAASLLDLPVPEGLDGREVTRPESPVYTPEEEAIVKNRLAGLGYL